MWVVPALAAPRLGGVVSPSNKPGPLFILPAPRRLRTSSPPQLPSIRFDFEAVDSRRRNAL